MTTNLTSGIVPDRRARMTALLHRNDYCVTVLGEGPIEHMRLQLQGCRRIDPLVRVLTLFVRAELRDAGRPLHWRDVERAWRANRLRAGRPVFSEERFWEYLTPAMAVGVIECSWNEEWANSE